ncbi:MAG: hypothetical protein GPJ54_03390 [Candidatus Heimdallarchaeota archaeon]|nr:hypothetical protein [Candidatus Heimdallarchaeota archaeon]
MNGSSFRIKWLLTIALALALIQTQPAIAATQTFVGPTFPEAELDLSDSLISTSWEDITTFSSVKEFGTGGFVKFSHNTTHVFVLLAANLTQWIAIEFGSDGQECMVTGNDAWIFYINEQEQSIQPVDSKYNGLAVPDPDTQDDLATEAIFDEDFIYIEVMRKFDTLDNSGGDHVFSNGSTSYITFASKDDHFDDRTAYYLQIQFSDTGAVQDIVVPEVVDWNERKDLLLFSSLIAVTLFIATHYLVRVKFRPLAHGSRFIDSTIMKAPKFKERWNTLLDRQPERKKDENSENIEGGNA